MADSQQNNNTQDQGKGDDKNQNSQNQDAGKKDQNQDQGWTPDKGLTDEQWKFAFGHERFKTLNDRAKRADELEAQIKADEDKRLEDDKKYQDLAEKRKQENETLKAQIQNQTKTQAIVQAAIKAGIKDTDVAVKLIDLSKVEIDSDGSVKNADDLVKALAEEKPYLVNSDSNSNVGSGTNVSGDGGGTKKMWKQSELKKLLLDHQWYLKNKDEIEAAQREGRIDPNS